MKGIVMAKKAAVAIASRRDILNFAPRSIIIPSTNLKVIGVHKLQDYLTCQRMFFWKWVYNLIAIKPNYNFWFGSLLHCGAEGLNKNSSEKDVRAAIQAKSKKVLEPFGVDSDTDVELSTQVDMINLLVKHLKIFMSKIKGRGVGTVKNEQRFKIPLQSCDVCLHGTLDSYTVLKDGTIVLEEYKSASQVDDFYFQRLKFDKQINSYALGLKSLEGRYPKSCRYFVIKKPAIRMRQNESVTGFLNRLDIDLDERKEWYYFMENIPFAPRALLEVNRDVEQATMDLLYKYMQAKNADQLCDPYYWPRNDKQCLNYGACPYFVLCAKTHNFQLYTKLFMMRDIRYNEELQELDTSRAMDITKGCAGVNAKAIEGLFQAKVNEMTTVHRLERCNDSI
jgi:hypothetical protein